MRKNRRIPKKMSVVAANSMRFGAIIVLFFVMVILYHLSSLNCTMLLKEKGAKEFGIHAFLASNTTTNDYWPTLAMQLFRHKTTMEHWYFTAVNVLGILLHTAAIVCLVVFML